MLRHPLNTAVGTVELSDIFLGLGVAILGVGLIQDLGVLVLRGRFGCESCKVPHGHWVVCAESVVGVALVALGLLHLVLGVVRPVTLTPGLMGLLAGGALVAYGLLRGRVVSIRREDDHRNVVY
jgi:hypothetical protein